MELRDKLNSLAAQVTSKANTAIETGKLTLKINAEEKKIAEYTISLGELFLDKLDAGEAYGDEAAALYNSILASREAIAEARTELENARQSLCPCCGVKLTEGANFCANCGTRVVPEEPEAEEEIVEVEEAAEAEAKEEAAAEAEAEPAAPCCACEAAQPEEAPAEEPKAED